MRHDMVGFSTVEINREDTRVELLFQHGTDVLVLIPIQRYIGIKGFLNTFSFKIKTNLSQLCSDRSPKANIYNKQLALMPHQKIIINCKFKPKL